MEIRELSWFITLAETQNVTTAASALNISQPTLSRALARLERHVGVRLFERQQNRLRLNKYGAIYKEHALKAVAELALGEERIKTSADPEIGVIAIGFLHSLGDWLLPAMLDSYHSRAPKNTLELEGGSTEFIVGGVRDGRLDVGLVAPGPTADDLVWIPLGQERLHVEVSPGHEFEGRETLTVSDLDDRAMLALNTNSALRGIVDKLFEDAGVTPRVIVEASELSTLRALVRHGGGMAIVPVAPHRDESRSTLIPLVGDDAVRLYGAIFRKDGPKGKAAQAFIQFIATSWRLR